MALLIACMVFVTTSLLLLSVLLLIKGQVATEHKAQSLQEGSLLDFDERLTTSLFRRVSLWFYSKFGQTFARFTPRKIYNFIDEKIIAAGGFYGMGSMEFLVLEVAAALLLALLCGLVTGIIMNMSLKDIFISSLYGFGVGVSGPLLVLNRRVFKRRQAIQKSLPGFLDMTYVSIQAGLSFDGALEKMAERMKGPLMTEFIRALHEIRMGVSRRIALKNVAGRCKGTDVPVFVSAMVQGEQLGISMNKIIETQANMLRKKRHTQIKEQALKAPIKVVFPLAFLILPALFIIILGPIIIQVKKISLW